GSPSLRSCLTTTHTQGLSSSPTGIHFLSLSFSLSLSPTLTQTHTHTHTHTYTHTHTHTHTSTPTAEGFAAERREARGSLKHAAPPQEGLEGDDPWGDYIN